MKFHLPKAVICSLIFLVSFSFKINAQGCGVNVPVYTVDLTGKPDSTWISPSIVRNDLCCSAILPSRCVKFIVTLDPASLGLNLTITGSAMGVVYYQVDCGSMQPVGEPKCLAGGGTYIVTMCAPGTSSNQYWIQSLTSLPSLDAGPDITICANATASLSGTGVYSHTRWTTSGTGSFDDSLAYATNYMPSIADRNAGSVTLTLSNECNSVSDDVVLMFNPLPDANVGTNTAICQGASGSIGGVSNAGSTYSWTSVPAGFTSTVSNPAITPAVNTKYILTETTTATGCINSDSITVVVDPNPVADFNANTTCYIDSIRFYNNSSISSGTITSWNWNFGDAGTGTQQVAAHYYSAAGIYTVQLIATSNLGCSDTVSHLVNVPAIMDVSISSGLISCNGVCDGTLTANAIAGSAPYSFLWNAIPSGAAVSNTQAALGLCSGTYMVTLSDNNGCIVSDTASLMSPVITDINGHVTYSGGDLSSGTNVAVLYNHLSVFTAFDTVATATINAQGNYNFTTVAAGDYLIKIFPDTLVYSTLVPTYFGNQFLWDSASVITHGCAADTADIVMVEDTTSGTGPGFISGLVMEGIGFGRTPGDPIPGIDVKLGRNPGGQFVTNTLTDATGAYMFSGIAENTNSPTDSSYTVFVDIPGLDRVSVYTFVVTGARNQFSNLDYYVDSTTIYAGNSTVGTSDSGREEDKFSVYPNPSKENVTIAYALTSETKVSIAVYNMLGVKMMSVLDKKQSTGKYKYTLDIKTGNLSSGIYFIMMMKDGKTCIQRLVVTE